MKSKIRNILIELYDRNITIDNATEEVLRLFDVSGNKAIQSENKKESEVALPVEDVNSVIEMLKQHHYTQEEMDECGWDANKIEHLDAHAFDNSVMINLLGGKLDRQ